MSNVVEGTLLWHNVLLLIDKLFPVYPVWYILYSQIHESLNTLNCVELNVSLSDTPDINLDVL